MARTVEDLAGCPIAFTTAEDAEDALDAGVEDVLACSLTPFATRLATVPPMVLDAAAEVPTYGDHFAGRPQEAKVEVDGSLVRPLPLAVDGSDRVLIAAPLPDAVVDVLSALGAGAAVVLLRSGHAPDAVRAEAVTALVEGGQLTRC